MNNKFIIAILFRDILFSFFARSLVPFTHIPYLSLFSSQLTHADEINQPVHSLLFTSSMSMPFAEKLQILEVGVLGPKVRWRRPPGRVSLMLPCQVRRQDLQLRSSELLIRAERQRVVLLQFVVAEDATWTEQCSVLDVLVKVHVLQSRILVCLRKRLPLLRWVNRIEMGVYLTNNHRRTILVSLITLGFVSDEGISPGEQIVFQAKCLLDVSIVHCWCVFDWHLVAILSQVFKEVETLVLLDLSSHTLLSHLIMELVLDNLSIVEAAASIWPIEDIFIPLYDPLLHLQPPCLPLILHFHLLHFLDLLTGARQQIESLWISRTSSPTGRHWLLKWRRLHQIGWPPAVLVLTLDI